MFETITNSFNIADLSSSGLVVDLPSAIEDFYYDWIIGLDYTISGTDYHSEFVIKGNTITLIEFSNSLSLAGATSLSYTISFVSQELISKFDSDMAISSKVPAALYTKKEAQVRNFFEQKIKANFRNLYAAYETTNPLTLIYNLFEIQTAYIYYLIAQLYFDLITEPNDTNEIKYREYMKFYNGIFADSMSLLAVDVDESGALSNAEKSKSVGSGGFLSR